MFVERPENRLNAAFFSDNTDQLAGIVAETRTLTRSCLISDLPTSDRFAASVTGEKAIRLPLLARACLLQ
jgi:hypothetical protein